MTKPEKASQIEGADFPYNGSRICYMEVEKDGAVSYGRPDRDALLRAFEGKSKIFAAWPGEWSTRIFEIDDLDRCALELGFKPFSKDRHIHDVIWYESEYDAGSGQTADVNLKFLCGCEPESIKVIAVELREALDWEVRVSGGWSGGWSARGGRSYSIRVGRKSLQNEASKISRNIAVRDRN